MKWMLRLVNARQTPDPSFLHCTKAEVGRTKSLGVKEKKVEASISDEKGIKTNL